MLEADAFPVQFAVDPTGPQGGSLLASLISMPSTLERMTLGGPVGYIIMIIGVLATLLFGWRFSSLWRLRDGVQAQAESATLSEDNALGRILKIAEDNPSSNTETLELKMAEQILKERPNIEGLNWVLKIVSEREPVGYYAWNRSTEQILFWSRYGFSLQLVNLRNNSARYITGDAIPVSPQIIPGTDNFSFVHRQGNGEVWIKELNPTTFSIRPLGVQA
jgi:hypothetical protein